MHHYERSNVVFFRHSASPFAKILAQFEINVRRNFHTWRSDLSLRNTGIGGTLAPPGSPCGCRCRQERGQATTNITGVACGPLRSLPEVQADFTMTATPRIHEASDGVVALPGPVFLGRVADLLDEVRQQTRVAFLP